MGKKEHERPCELYLNYLIAYKLRRHLADYVDFTIYEKSAELGGTWHENTYPGEELRRLKLFISNDLEY